MLVFGLFFAGVLTCLAVGLLAPALEKDISTTTWDCPPGVSQYDPRTCFGVDLKVCLCERDVVALRTHTTTHNERLTPHAHSPVKHGLAPCKASRASTKNFLYRW